MDSGMITEVRSAMDNLDEEPLWQGNRVDKIIPLGEKLYYIVHIPDWVRSEFPCKIE